MFDKNRLNRLYRYGIALTNDESLSYDLLQDALESFLKLPRTQQHIKSSDAYIRACMRNRHIDQLRHTKRFPKESLDADSREFASMLWPDPAELVLEVDSVQSLLDQLQPLERELLHLWAYEEYTAQEIADLQNVPRGTILSRVHRLRAKLVALTQPAMAVDGEIAS